MSAAASPSGSEDPEPPRRGAPAAPRLWTPAFVDLLIAEVLFGFSYALFVLLPKLLAAGHGAMAGQIGAVMASFGVASLVTIPALFFWLVVNLLQKNNLPGHCTFTPAADKPSVGFSCVDGIHERRGAYSNKQSELMAKLLRGAWPLNDFPVLGLTAAAVTLPFSGVGMTASAAAPERAHGADVTALTGCGSSPLWLAPSSGAAATQLLSPPRRPRPIISIRSGTTCVAFSALSMARRGDPAAVQRAEAMLSQAFVTCYAATSSTIRASASSTSIPSSSRRRLGRELLNAGRAAPSLSDYVQQMGWMNPIYAKLRAGDRQPHLSQRAERRLLTLNLERARALPSGNGRYVIVNPPAARLYMYENGQVVDSMRVVAGRPDPIAQTPMMNAFIRYVALNPYWNSPPDITSRKLAPTILKEGRAYFTKRGYDLVDISAETRTSSTLCRMTGGRSPPAACRSFCGRSRVRPIRWAE